MNQLTQLAQLLESFGLVVNVEDLAPGHPQRVEKGATNSIHITSLDDHPPGLVGFLSLDVPDQPCANNNVEFFFDAQGKFLYLEFAH